MAGYVGQDGDFRHFVEDAAAGELRATHQVPLAILAPTRRRLYEGVGSRVMPLYAGAGRHGARHIWERHGPESGRPAWERLAWSDWLYVQRMVDELDPVRQRDGRWRLASPGWLTVQRRSVGFVLIADLRGGALTPVTLFRAKR